MSDDIDPFAFMNEPPPPEPTTVAKAGTIFVELREPTADEIARWRGEKPTELLYQLHYVGLLPGFFGLPDDSVNAHHGAKFQLSDSKLTFEAGLAKLKEEFGVDLSVIEYILLVEDM